MASPRSRDQKRASFISTNIQQGCYIQLIMQRRSFLSTPLAAFQAAAATAPTDDRVYAFGDGIPLKPDEYTQLLANLTKGPHGLLIPLLALVVFLASARDLGFVKRMGLVWGLPLALVPVGLWVAAFRSTGEPFPLETLLLRLAHRFTRGEHHAQPFYHVLISLPAEFFPWVILLPAALWQTFPRRGARPDRDNAYVYSWILVIFTVFAASVEKRGVYLLPLLPLLALLVARLWDLALILRWRSAALSSCCRRSGSGPPTSWVRPPSWHRWRVSRSSCPWSSIGDAGAGPPWLPSAPACS